ncbi:hypothetical protein HMN09_01025300 [Mycena chlorophos]|uniref:Uncharacterized protein n=1 Tax=Mycena chlorophos TaxID=658473 RepID=A0A8H6SEG0_MYCCL|nr:hypothetical protein HMN09_01025300 [Mycena chlorophos]
MSEFGAYPRILQSATKRTARKSVPRKVVAQQRPESALGPFESVPNEILLEIIEFALANGTFAGDIACVCRPFGSLIDHIVYKTVVLNSAARIARFCYTARARRQAFMTRHVRRLVVSAPDCFTVEVRSQLETILSVCRGVQAMAIPRPAILVAPDVVSQTRLNELTIQQFDAMTPFEWDPQFGEAGASPAAHLTRQISHLRVCEPAAAPLFHPPAEIIEFFGPLENLTHLALACRSTQPLHKSRIFLQDIQELLLARPALRVVVVSIFGHDRRRLCGTECLCTALQGLRDRRVVVLAGSHGFGALGAARNKGFSMPLTGSGHRAAAFQFTEEATLTATGDPVVWENPGPDASWEHSPAKWSYWDIPVEIQEGREFWDRWK